MVLSHLVALTKIVSDQVLGPFIVSAPSPRLDSEVPTLAAEGHGLEPSGAPRPYLRLSGHLAEPLFGAAMGFPRPPEELSERYRSGAHPRWLLLEKRPLLQSNGRSGALWET